VSRSLIDPERASERAAPRNLSNVVFITTPAIAVIV
jgi:hypothetical protein